MNATLLTSLSFQDELRAEEGYAFEKQVRQLCPLPRPRLTFSLFKLWGGKLDSLAPNDSGFTHHDGFPDNIACLREWPNTRCRPRPYYRSTVARSDELHNDSWPVWLTDPPPTLVRRETALPVTILSRYLDRRFWSSSFRKYGQQALKLPRHRWEDKPLKSRLFFVLFSRREVERAFGSTTAFRWMRYARETLVAAREFALASYMMDFSRSIVEADMMRRRLHYEKKTWPVTDAKLIRLGRLLTRTRHLATMRLGDYRARRGDSPLGAAEVITALTMYLTEMRLLYIQAKDLDRLLGEEIPYLQYLTLGFLRQDDNTRARLQGYMNVISVRVHRVLRPAADNIISTTAEIKAEWLGVVTDYTEACVAQGVRVDRAVSNLEGTLTTMSADATAIFPSTRQLVSDLRDVVQDGWRVVARRVADPPPGLAGSFNLLADSVGLREIRTQRMRLRNLALRDMRRISHDGNLRAIVEQWLAILQIHDRLRGAATEEERRAIRREGPIDFPQPPAVAFGNVEWDDSYEF